MTAQASSLRATAKSIGIALSKIAWGNLYEGLLERNAKETKPGAGQYFTLPTLVNSMVRYIALSLTALFVVAV